MVVLLIAGVVGCRPLPETPGFDGIPMHPNALDVSLSEGQVRYWLRGMEQDPVIEFYIRHLEREQHWTLVEQWGSALLYERKGRAVLLEISQVGEDTVVSIRDSQPG